MINKCDKQCDCCGDRKETGCAGEAQDCAGCRSKERACGGCAGGCPHAAGNELQWDYDDTVLVFSSDMLEEESP